MSKRSGLRVPRVLDVGALRQQPLAATLTTAGESGAAALGAHARAEAVLAFPGAFRRLESAFHKQAAAERRRRLH